MGGLLAGLAARAARIVARILIALGFTVVIAMAFVMAAGIMLGALKVGL